MMPQTAWQDTDDLIFCRLCGQKIVMMTQTHLSKHFMTFDKYKEKFPEAPLTSHNKMIKNQKDFEIELENKNVKNKKSRY